jgi:multimeric flavodoxin WrbA
MTRLCRERGSEVKVTAFNGSARRNGNTSSLIKTVFSELEAQGIATELHQLAGKDARGCIACYKCFAKKDRQCHGRNDFINECIEKMDNADGVILGSPTYFADVTPEIKALMDRAGLVAKANGDMLRRKVGAAVVAVRRAGSIHVFDSLNHFFFIGQMVVPGASYWNVGRGREPGEVEDDEEGIRTMEVLGKNMAWLLTKLND